MKKFFSTAAATILHSNLPLPRQMNCPVLLSSHFPEQDREFGLDMLTDWFPRTCPPFSRSGVAWKPYGSAPSSRKCSTNAWKRVLQEHDRIYAGKSLTAAELVEHVITQVVRQPAL